jgi:hypothetical protein
MVTALLHSAPKLARMNQRLIMGCVLALTGVACGSASAAVATPTTRILNGSGFSALYPESWSLAKQAMKGATQYQLSSRGTLSTAGVPKPGAIGITIQVVPFAVIQAAGRSNPATWTPVQLVNGTIGTPPGATTVKVSVPAHGVSFADGTGYTVNFTYSVAGTPNVQEDLVEVHAKVVYLVELDAEPTLQALGEAAMKTLTTTWGWATA